MKIRLDFVTNSSSSSYIYVDVCLNDGTKYSGEQYLEAGYGSDLIQQERSLYKIVHNFEACSNGEDVLEAVSSSISGYFETWFGEEYCDLIRQIPSVDCIDNIKLTEYLHYDTGGGAEAEFEYSYTEKRITKCEYAQYEADEDEF